MSTIEKAAEKLRAARPEPGSMTHVDPGLQIDTAPAQALPTIERLQERSREPERPMEPASLWPVDLRALEKAGILTADRAAAGRLADELRRVKRSLLSNAIGKGTKPLVHPERIAITSAEPSEGKTFIAVNLALSLARERDFEVLLVDGDVAKSDATRAFGLDGRPGLMDTLEDERYRPTDVIVHTDVPNLLVVPAGTHLPLGTELFGSLRMQYVLEQLGGRNPRRLVVFDSPPLLATSEAQALVSHMGQILVVVASGRTRRQTVNTALQGLNDSQYVGMVLNMSHMPASENHYDSYYAQGSNDHEGAA
ncbi:MAG TPA: AAA family ATPase [Rhodanobacteraceae bacterium]|nr:AAA family ATPase [Rhodanobacteraceae bacterium]